MQCPAPKRWLRSRSSRKTAESNFWAATVPSQDSGGVRQVSQLPQAAVVVSPKYSSSWTRRQRTVSQRASIASRCAARLRRWARSPSDVSIILRCWTTSCSPYASQAVDGRPSRPARPVSW